MFVESVDTISRTSSVPIVISSASKVVPLSSCNLSDLSLAVITLDPAFLFANSINPSSVPSLASCIFPVIFAYTIS